MKIWYQSASSYRYEPVWDDYGRTLEQQCKAILRPETGLYVTGIPEMVRDIENWSSRSGTVKVSNLPTVQTVQGTVEDVGFDERTTVAGVHDLMTAAGDILPGAWQASLKEVRVGLRPAPSGTTPYVGPAANSARGILATGHFRNGVMLAPLTAEKVRAAVRAL